MIKQNFTKIAFLRILTLVFCIYGCFSEANAFTKKQQKLQDYNVIWDSPSKDYNGSMPIGNGDIGLNVWVEESGDLCFYIGKIDTWDENGRLLKVGKVRVKCNPALVFKSSKFKQELDLKTGSILISSRGRLKGKEVFFKMQVWVDANNPVIHIDHQSSQPVSMTACIELWRKERQALKSLEVSDLFNDFSVPNQMSQQVFVEPDSILPGSDQHIGWFHHNSKSVGFDFTNQLQGLSEHFSDDPIKNRTFGAIITGTGTKCLNDTTLQTAETENSRLNVFVLTKYPSTSSEWYDDIRKLSDSNDQISYNKRKAKHNQWWKGFWNRSYIHATCVTDSVSTKKNDEAFSLSQAYALQRFVTASAGRGKYPIKFNGSIFTVPYQDAPGNADYRRWGPGYWWQNTRLPYISLYASGDFEMMKPLFDMYTGDIYQLNKFRTKKYFGFDGAYFAECIYPWGAVFTSSYGYVPFEKRTDKLQEIEYHKREWVSGLELVFMMLDYYDYTGDTQFLNKKIVPLANDVLKFFDNYYKCNEQGKLVMYPSQALETWWDCTNPMPELAGLYGVSSRLLALPENLTNTQDREFWKAIAVKLPEIPVRETPSGKALAPAARFERLQNVEIPELYSVFPFRLYGLGRPDIDLAKNALEHTWHKGTFGWRQDDLFMAYLGLTDQAKQALIGRVNQKSDQNLSRFPAFWGPNYDWTPDQDHSGMLMKVFQSLLLQTDPYSRKIYLTPAWPKGWNADFKLHAPYNTIVEGSVSNGKITMLKVTPSSRKKDVIVLNESKIN
jgi:alpha-L-fucosidase 2